MKDAKVVLKQSSFQGWIRDLICNATSQNKAHVVACLSSNVLRTLYDQGAAPSVEAILTHCASVNRKLDRSPTTGKQKYPAA